MTLAGVALIALLAGCGEKNTYAPPPPPTVTVSHPLRQDVTDYLEFTGTTRAVASVDIRSQVQGFLDRMNFTEGATVRQGDLLYLIDQRPFRAAAEKASAELSSAQAEYRDAEADYERYARMFEQGVIDQSDYQAERAKRDAAREAVNAARANLIDALLNLQYTEIRAPMAGRVGLTQLVPGNLVLAQSTVLTTLIQYDPMYAYFTVSERELLRLRESHRRPGEPPVTMRPISVEMALATDEGYPHRGHLDFADLGVDPTTGTYRARAVFPNGDGALLPGLFVRLRVPSARQLNALLVPEQAIGRDQRGDYLLLVNDEDVVEERVVQLGPLVQGMRVIDEGLQLTDWVVVNGIQRAHPGSKVRPERTPASASGAPSSPEAESGPISG